MVYLSVMNGMKRLLFGALAVSLTGCVYTTPPELPPLSDMVWIPGGDFLMGSDESYPEEAPQHQVRVPGFWMDTHEVTNREFQAFVEATGYVTDAERPLDPTLFPEFPAEMLVPGSSVFGYQQESGRWWRFVAGAYWRHPEGPDSSIEERLDHPVVHVTPADARAYAAWRGNSLPTEAQWEFAAGDARPFNEQDGAVRYVANTWQGDFPRTNTVEDGYLATAPVESFPPNQYGLYDMLGNVWEITADRYAPFHDTEEVENPAGCHETKSHDPQKPGVDVQVIKGGSFLCAPNYCRRYRATARHSQDMTLGTSHIGFRTVRVPSSAASER